MDKFGFKRCEYEQQVSGVYLQRQGIGDCAPKLDRKGRKVCGLPCARSSNRISKRLETAFSSYEKL